MYNGIGIKYLCILRYIPVIFNVKDSYSGIGNRYSKIFPAIFNQHWYIFVVYSKDFDIFPWYSISNICNVELIAGNPVYSCDIQSLPIYSWHIQNIAAYSRYIRTWQNMRLAILARLLPIYSWHIQITLNYKKMDRPMCHGKPTSYRYIQTCRIPPYVKKLVYCWHIQRITIVRLWMMGVR